MTWPIRTDRLLLRPVEEGDLDFLLGLWNDPETMRYAGGERNWTRGDILEWFGSYTRRHPSFPDDLFPEEIHLVILLPPDTRAGESGLGELPQNWRCEGFAVPAGVRAGMCDVKLAGPFRGKGYATEAMRAVARFFRQETDLDILIVPPHEDNPAAIRVYEKAGFRMTRGRAWGHHLVMVAEKDAGAGL